MPLAIKTMLHLQKANEAIEQGKREDALQHLNALDEAFAIESAGATPAERTMMLAASAGLYARAGELEVAVMKFEDVCRHAERCDPNTTETAGDYSSLAEVLERLGRLSEALKAWDASARHLQGAGVWDRYRAGYEKRSDDLRRRLAAESG